MHGNAKSAENTPTLQKRKNFTIFLAAGNGGAYKRHA
jgi:hypothetical protein